MSAGLPTLVAYHGVRLFRGIIIIHSKASTPGGRCGGSPPGGLAVHIDRRVRQVRRRPHDGTFRGENGKMKPRPRFWSCQGEPLPLRRLDAGFGPIESRAGIAPANVALA